MKCLGFWRRENRCFFFNCFFIYSTICFIEVFGLLGELIEIYIGLISSLLVIILIEVEIVVDNINVCFFVGNLLIIFWIY